MSGKYLKKKKNRFPYLLTVLLVAVLAAGSIFAINRLAGNGSTNLGDQLSALTPTAAAEGKQETTAAAQQVTTEPETEPETEPPTTLPEPESVVSTATVGAMGDLLMHTPLFLGQYNSANYNSSDGTYNFDSIFKYISSYISGLDYAAANLETTLAGTARAYSGFPNFNCPDAIVDGAMDAGFDLLLTANNHCFDTGMDGYLRTIEVCEEKQVDHLGTMTSDQDPKYIVKDINGIKIGMICYTYETTEGTGSYPSLNGLPMYGGSYGMINTFTTSNPQKFYNELEERVGQMRDDGAEAIIVYIHWGVEYQSKPNDFQKNTAQKLCDMGVDVIIGGHPHVVQPVNLIRSTVDDSHTTVCMYSLGNAVSNQRQGISQLFPPDGSTEDGALFTVTFEKYSDGTVYVRNANVIPTWVMLRTQSKREYNILPLDIETQDQWQTLYDLPDASVNAAKKSYARTNSLMEAGLAEIREYLEQAKIDREDYYYKLAFGLLDEAPAEEAETVEIETTELNNAA